MKYHQTQPKVSICCLAFNHKQFIRKALDGFMMQETNFEFEVVIHDDASTDGTDQIIREYESKFPNIIKALYQTENQWKKGIRGSSVHNFPRAAGKYIALCEGDDYWTDPKKLQRQADFLDHHDEYALVAENGLVINSEFNTQYPFNDIAECDIEINQLLGVRQFPTASVLFRNSCLDKRFLQLKHTGDVILWCYLATKGKIRYFPNVSSVYSKGLHGIVLSTRNVAWARMLEEWNETLDEILPKTVDRKILKLRNFKEYSYLLYLSAKQKNVKVSFIALRKSLQYMSLNAFKVLLKSSNKKFSLKKLLR